MNMHLQSMQFELGAIYIDYPLDCCTLCWF